MSSRLHERYRTEVVPALTRQFEYTNPNQVPRVSKIVVNVGLGEATAARRPVARPPVARQIVPEPIASLSSRDSKLLGSIKRSLLAAAIGRSS